MKTDITKSNDHFPTVLQKVQFYDKYARFNTELGRRETWEETVSRTVNFLRELSDNTLHPDIYDHIEQAILDMQIMPSMRLLAMAGEAARRNNLCLYNCSYMPVDSLDSFVEALIISMNGCGVGFSVEKRYVDKLPSIKPQGSFPVSYFLIEDSAEGWADAMRAGLEAWFNGRDISFDYMLIRPYGSPLRVKGGRASGPEPLRKMLDFIRSTVLSADGRLTTLQAHDIMCEIGNAAVSGGVRRTAMLSLFDFDDMAMEGAKEGEFPERRWNANNSSVWPDRVLSESEISDFFGKIVNGGNGEPGIFNRAAVRRTSPSRRLNDEFGTNPCGEIVLKPRQLCNLSSVVCRHDDDKNSLINKVVLATIVGTIQSMATHFPGLRKDWEINCEKERLLGVDLNGQMDCPSVQDEATLRLLSNAARHTNEHYAGLLGINPSVAITTCKPSGNSSVLLNCSSGIHSRFAPYYIRRVRIATSSPIWSVLRNAGVPSVPENGQEADTAITWVFSFPVAAPEGSDTRRTALEQLSYWARVKRNYAEHNVSVTINYSLDEVGDISEWLHKNQGIIGGISFLPISNANYANMPYEAIDRDTYLSLLENMPEVDFSTLYLYESEDLTTSAQELACVAGYCEI